MAGPLPSPSDPLAGDASAMAALLVAALVRDGFGGPVFVVATDDAVGALAPVWAEAFARVGWHHRVRVVAPWADAAELADVAADVAVGISGFATDVIVVAAPPEIVAAVGELAGAVPVVVWPTLPRPAEGNGVPGD